MLHALGTPDIRLLRVFMTVVESGGFSAAQIHLNVGQSTISTHMRDLETRLGMRLCRRGRSGFALTEDGKLVYKAAKSLFRSMDQFTSTINDARGSLSGELRIVFADVLYGNPQFKLADAIEMFQAENENVHFDLSIANPLDIEQGVLAEHYHIGIHTFPSRVPGLRYTPLFREKQTLFCGRRHPLSEHDPSSLSLSQLQSNDYVQRAYYGGALPAGAFKAGRIRATADNMEAIYVLLTSGRYIGHLPALWAEHHVKNGELISLLPDETSYHSQFDVVVRVGTAQSKLVSTFLVGLTSAFDIHECPTQPDAV